MRIRFGAVYLIIVKGCKARISSREICQHLTLGLFVPFNLMMCAILSRLWYFCVHNHLFSYFTSFFRTYLKYHVKFLSQAHVILTRDHNVKVDLCLIQLV